MQIHVQRGEEELGVFTPVETTKYLAQGRLLETDLAWHEGLNDWVPLGELCQQLEQTKPISGITKSGQQGKEEPPVFGQGRYQREKVLGIGGQGEVWLAHDLQLERQVAIKQVNEQFAPGTMAYQSLKDEVQKSLELTHPNITRIYDLVDVPGESPFIAMEYLKGEDLHVKMGKQEGGHFSWAEIEPYILSLCDALEYAHEQGMVHRDLKPANLMITDSGELKLTDMGIAEPAKDPDASSETEDFISGTPPYWSPQQSQGIKSQATDDIYSLGATLYHLLTGRPPFLGENEEEITNQHLTRTPDDLQQVLKEGGHATQVPAYINQLVLKCLAKDPASRPRGTAYIRDWIKAKGDPAVKKQKRMMMAAAAMGIVALAMGGLAIWAWDQRNESVLSRVAESTQRGIAETKQKEAETARQKAEAAQKAEAEQKEIALKEKEKAEQQNYFNVMAQAVVKIDEGAYDQAKAILWAAPKNLRNWEWGHLVHLCNQEFITLKGHGDVVASVAFSPDGQRVVTGSGDGTAKIWDATSGTELLTLKEHGGLVFTVAFSPDSRRVLTGSLPDAGDGEGTVKIWDAENGQKLRTIEFDGFPFVSLAFSPDGQRMVTGFGVTTTAVIYDTENGRKLMDLSGHAKGVVSLAFSLDGRRVVTGSVDKTAKVWDAETGKELLTLNGHGDVVASAAFSPDGRRVISWNQGSFKGGLDMHEPASILRSEEKTARSLDAVDWTLTKEEFENQKLEHYQAWLKKNEADQKKPKQ